jgi:16S rRNA (cytosine967-C5)-methyltransferase
MSDVRDIVTQRIAKEIKRFPDIHLSPLDIEHLDSRDAALVRAIDHAIRRRWITLSTLISHASNRSMQQLDAPVGAVLLVASAQLMLLDRVPDHAVIHCAVEWIRNKGKRPRATGFVNAVLRSITRLRGSLLKSGTVGQANHFLLSDGSAWELTEPVFENGIAAQTGFSDTAWLRLMDGLGLQTATKIVFGSIAEPPVIVTIPAGNKLPEQVIPHQQMNFGVVPSGVDIGALLASEPTLRVQDPASAAPMELLKELRPRRILDLCAGRGTKTKQLRSLFPDAFIGATEPNNARRASLELLAKDFDIEVYAPNTEGPNKPFDLVVVDTPCTNSGVFARRPEARYRFDKEHIDSLVTLQRTILKDAIAVMERGGHLLYATCSVDNAENHAQVDWMTNSQRFEPCADTFSLPSGFPGSDPTSWQDGGYAALLQGR